MSTLAVDLPEEGRPSSLMSRFWRRDVLFMFVRNTVISTLVFGIGLGVLWLMVERFDLDKTLAAGIGFIIANSLHYLAARTWIYRGTQRNPAQGYVYFLVNGAIGLVITLALFAALVGWGGVHYLVARVLVSVIAGMVMFALNASLNFRRV